MKSFFTSFQLITLFLCTLIVQLHAQQNGGLESWSPSGSPPPFDWKFPTGWTTNNATTEFISAGVTRNTYHFGGEFAAQIKTLNIFGTLTRSQLTLGNAKLDYLNYQIKTYSGGEPLAMVPHQVSFYYQLTTGAPSEYAVADILIKRSSGSEIPEIIFHQSVLLPSVDFYTEMNVDIPDAGINTATDSIVILFSSNDTNEVAANILYVDEVSIDFTSANLPVPGSPQITLFPNPLSEGETLNVNFSALDYKQLDLIDYTGRVVQHDVEIMGAHTLQLCTGHLLPGIYCLVIDHAYKRPFLIVE